MIRGTRAAKARVTIGAINNKPQPNDALLCVNVILFTMLLRLITLVAAFNIRSTVLHHV